MLAIYFHQQTFNMRRFTFTFFLFFLLMDVLSAQTSFNFSELTNADRDSLRKGIITPEMKGKVEKMRLIEKMSRDSFIQNKIINQPIPDFDARDTEGVMHRLAMYRGRVWLIYFWHFWDNSFQYEIPALNTLVDSLRGEGVEVLSFINYSLGESEQKHLIDRPIRFPIVENSLQFGNAFFGLSFPRPYVAIIDKKGICRYFYDGQTLPFGFKYGHRNELLQENKRNQPTYDFMEKVKSLLRE